jgi:hypothetical protein
MVPGAPTHPRQRTHNEPLYDIHPRTGASIEVFYADRALETFGRSAAGWFWWPHRRGCSSDGSPTGPFATSYALCSISARNGGQFEDRKDTAIRSLREVSKLAYLFGEEGGIAPPFTETQ